MSYMVAESKRLALESKLADLHDEVVTAAIAFRQARKAGDDQAIDRARAELEMLVDELLTANKTLETLGRRRKR